MKLIFSVRYETETEVELLVICQMLAIRHGMFNDLIKTRLSSVSFVSMFELLMWSPHPERPKIECTCVGSLRMETDIQEDCGLCI
jgi:hypothetical protein